MKENATRADRELRIARTHEEKLFRWQKANPFPRVSRVGISFAKVQRGEKFELPASCEKSRDEERVRFVLFGRNNELRRSTSGGKIIGPR